MRATVRTLFNLKTNVRSVIERPRLMFCRRYAGRPDDDTVPVLVNKLSPTRDRPDRSTAGSVLGEHGEGHQIRCATTIQLAASPTSNTAKAIIATLEPVPAALSRSCIPSDQPAENDSSDVQCVKSDGVTRSQDEIKTVGRPIDHQRDPTDYKHPLRHDVPCCLSKQGAI